MELHDDQSPMNSSCNSNVKRNKKITVWENQIESMLDRIMDEETEDNNLEFSDDDDSSTKSDKNNINWPAWTRSHHSNNRTVVVKNSQGSSQHQQLMSNMALVEEYQRKNKKYQTFSPKTSENATSTAPNYYQHSSAYGFPQVNMGNYTNNPYQSAGNEANTPNAYNSSIAPFYQIYPTTGQIYGNHLMNNITINNNNNNCQVNNQICMNGNICSSSNNGPGNTTTTHKVIDTYNTNNVNMNLWNNYSNNNNYNTSSNNMYICNNYLRNDIRKSTYDINPNYNANNPNNNFIPTNPHSSFAPNNNNSKPTSSNYVLSQSPESDHNNPITMNNCYKGTNHQAKEKRFLTMTVTSEVNMKTEIIWYDLTHSLSKTGKIDYLIYNKLQNNFISIIKTHKGSRIFQNYLKNTHSDIIHQIFQEISPHWNSIMEDSYANYFCKRFFTYLNQKDRIEFLQNVKSSITALSMNSIGTYPIQGIIEQVGSKNEKNIIVNAIKDSIKEFCYDTYGTHVLEKIITCFEEEFTSFIYEYIVNNFIELANNINGICLVKKILTFTHKKDLHEKLKKISYDNALEWIQHPYGNYVIQVIIESWEDNDILDVLSRFKNYYYKLSMQKYSSNVVERCLEKSTTVLTAYITEICSNGKVFEVIKNNFGNYVIQKALKISDGDNEKMLAIEVDKNLSKWVDKKLLLKWKSIVKPHWMKYGYIAHNDV